MNCDSRDCAIAETICTITICVSPSGANHHVRETDIFEGRGGVAAIGNLGRSVIAPGVRQAWFTAMTSFGTPQDVTVQELRIETFFPADDATAQLAHAAAEAPGS